MSASLVGSEMCIRDRGARRRAAVTRTEAARPTAPPGRRPAGTRQGREPVSYTHLTLPTICSV
eukprot:4766250-Alexandrium_andersonii.AAC.1